MLVGLIVIILILGIFIGATFFSRTTTQAKQNAESFVVDVFNDKMVSVYTSDCIEEYQNRYGYRNGECQITSASTQAGNSLLREYGCRCWIER